MLAIGGLDTAILKSATLCSSPAAWPLAPMLFQVIRCAGLRQDCHGPAKAACDCIVACTASTRLSMGLSARLVFTTCMPHIDHLV